MSSIEHLKRRGGLALIVALLLAGAACAPTEVAHVSDLPDESGEVIIGYDDGGAPRTLLLKPVDGARLTSRFGLRKNPMGGGGTRRHLGTDYGARAGAPIRAAGHGIVASVGLRGSYGNYVLIRHGHTHATGYAHMSRFADGLWSGQRVSKGQVIGYVGSTGRSTGPHLHYEVYDEGERIDPYDLPPALGGKVARKSFAFPDGTPEGTNRTASRKPDASPTVASKPDGASPTVARKSFNFLDTASETLSAAGKTLSAATETLFAATEGFSFGDTGEKLSAWGQQAKVAFEDEILSQLDLEKLFDGFGEEDPDVIHE
jgi:hypothetical protein